MASVSASPAPRPEFIGLMALMFSLVALAIDAMMPMLQQIGGDLGTTHPNDVQLVIGLLFLGLALGQLLFGPLSDSIGRKPAIQLGLGLFIFGCLLSAWASNFSVMLLGRLLQGIGLSAPRIVCIALIRDLYVGNAMAKVMSFVMSIFILVPAVAPTLGQAVLIWFDWRAIFGLFLGLAVVVSLWLGIRQEETLALERRIPFRPRRLYGGLREVLRNQHALGHTLAAGLIFGPFAGYLSTAQQVLQFQYELGEAFPSYFALLALSIGVASFVNSRLVSRFGMQNLIYLAIPALSLWSFGFWTYALLHQGQPPFVLFLIYLQVTFFCLGMLFGNINAMAMQTLGHIAGIGAAVVGFISTLLGIVVGTVIGQLYEQSVIPLVGGFAVAGLLALFAVRWANRHGGIVSLSEEPLSAKH